MSSDVEQPGLSQDDYQVIEKLNDIFALTLNPRHSLKTALELILAHLGYTQGAFFIQGEPPGQQSFWINEKVPLFAQNQIIDPESQINRLVRNAIYTRQILPAKPKTGLPSVFPVILDKPYGALLVFGPAVPESEHPKWSAFLKPVSRAIAILNGQQKITRKQELAALISISKILNTTTDFEQALFYGVEGISNYFEAEEAFLIMLDDENPSLAIRKCLGKGTVWKEQISYRLDDSAIGKTIREGNFLYDDSFSLDPSSVQWTNPYDKLEPEIVLCAPLALDDAIYGAVILINPLHQVSDSSQRMLLNTMTMALAATIHDFRQVLRLKISIADLEANRWNILNSRNTLRIFFDNIPVSVYIIDRAYSIVAINRSRSKRIGKHPKDLTGGKCYEYLYGRTAPCPGCRAIDTFNSGETTTRNHREWDNVDCFTDWEITTFAIRENSQIPQQAILFETDVTEKRTLQSNLIQSEKLAAMGQLAAGVAHEINNPLAAIIANAQLLRRDLRSQDSFILESLDLIETAGLRASQVVSNLLGIARKEQRIEYEAFPINETILSALSLVKHELTNHSITIQTDLQENIPEIIASKNHLQGLWINLIINSIDAIDKPDGRIWITSQYKDQCFKVCIEDNGKGIPEDQQARIFEPFFTTKGHGKGTGLGLSMCIQVIKEHLGNIQIESRPEKGAKFIVTLPDINRSQ